MPSRRKVLFICTGNACRSQMAEALLRHLGGDRFEPRSAGTHPAGFVHPVAVRTLQRMSIPVNGQCSKSWTVFRDDPQDIVITVCDVAASELNPAWPGQPVIAHWGVPDPSFVPGDQDDRLIAAAQVAQTLEHRIRELIELCTREISREQLQRELQRIAEDGGHHDDDDGGRGAAALNA